MLYKIKRGNHRATPIVFGLSINKRTIERYVTFHGDCAHNMSGEDIYDINKLFGIGYLWGGHHDDSARFGWVYSPNDGKIDIHAYTYVNGKRISEFICQLEIGKENYLKLEIKDGRYIFTIRDHKNQTFSTYIPFSHNKKVAYPLGLYFGGNLTPPHDMHVAMRK